MHRRTAELAERVPHAVEEVGVLLDEVLRAEVAAVLLVAQHREDQVAARLQLAARSAQERVDEHRDAALHVERAAAPDDAVDELGAERRVRPLLPCGLDDVDVAVEQERRRVAGAGRRATRFGRASSRAKIRDSTPGVVEQLLHVRDALAFVAGRVRRVEPDQVAQELDDVGQSSPSASSSRSTSAAVL